jgi:hypothetical protein
MFLYLKMRVDIKWKNSPGRSPKSLFREEFGWAQNKKHLVEV